MSGLFDDLAGVELPKGIDETDQEFKDFPTKVWGLGRVPAAGGRSCWEVQTFERNPQSRFEQELIAAGSPRVWGRLKGVLVPCGGELAVTRDMGPFGSVFFSLNSRGFVEKPKANDLKLADNVDLWPAPLREEYKAALLAGEGTVSEALIKMANALLSPQFEKGSVEKWHNTLSVLKRVASENKMVESEYPSKPLFFAATLAVAAHSEPRTLLFTVRYEKPREYTDNMSGEVKKTEPRLTLSRYDGDTPESRAKHKVVAWDEASGGGPVGGQKLSY